MTVQSTTRQVARQNLRAWHKSNDRKIRLAEHKLAKQDLLGRQSAREKSGFYEGQTPVASVLTPSRSRINTRKVKKGQFGGRIIGTRKDGANEIQRHATKGYRIYRA